MINVNKLKKMELLEPKIPTININLRTTNIPGGQIISLGNTRYVEPFRLNRFIVEINLPGFNPLDVTSVSLPTYRTNVIGVSDRDGITRNFPGSGSWDPITLKFRNSISENYMRTIYEQEYSLPRFDMTLKLLDPVGAPVSEWRIYDAIVTRYSYGTFSYEDDGCQEIELEILPSHCTLIY